MPAEVPSDQPHLTIHATTVALNGQAACITGPSGSGKSSLALQLMAYGATLVSDDRTILHLRDGALIASAPLAIAGQIEARGVGILAAPVSGATPVQLIVDMAQEECDRLPAHRRGEFLGVSLPLVRKTNSPHFPAAVSLYLQGNRIA